MLTAITRITGRVVVAIWRDDTVTDFADLPTVPDDCEWLELTQELYDSMPEIINSAGCLMYRLIDDPDPSGTYLKVRNLREKRFYAIVRSSDRGIIALDNAIPDFLRAGIEIIEIAQTDFLEINRGQLHIDSEGQVPAWSADVAGVVTPHTDIRPVLRVNQPSKAVAGQPIIINFVLEDSDGVTILVTASREIILRSPTKEDKWVTVNLVNGRRTVTPVLPAGRYELVTADSIAYRIDGDVVLDVSETWT